MAATVLEELVTILGFDIDDGDLKSFNERSKVTFSTLRNIALIGTGAAAGIGVFVNSVANATDATFKFAKTVGASFEEVQLLTHATKIWGGTAEDVMSTLKGLASITSKATRGAGGGEIFGILGISPSDAKTGGPKNTVALLKEIADNMDRMGDEARQLDLLSQLGVSENMILLLRKGSEGIEQIGEEVQRYGFVLSPKQGRVAEDFVDAMVRGKMAVRGLSTELGLRLAPPLMDIINGFLEWRATSRELIDTRLDEWVTKLVKSVKPLAYFMLLITGLAIAAGVIAYPLAAAFIALAAAIALMKDDYDAWLDGMTGTQTEKAIEKLNELRDAIREFNNSDLAGYLSDLNPYHPFNSMSSILNRYRRNAERDTTLNPSKTIISPTFNIRANDTGGIIRELDRKINSMWTGSDYLA